MSKINKLIIPVAGLGTRFLPATKSIPKEMLPIVDKPTIMLLMEEAKKANIKEVIFITNSRKKCIKDFFLEDVFLEEKLKNDEKIKILNDINELTKGIKIKFVNQDDPKGSGDAIYKAKDIINNEPFAVMYGDDLIKGGNALSELIEMYEKKDSNIIGIKKVELKNIYKYGIVQFKNDSTKEIESIIEKPNVFEAPSDYAGIGRYIFKPEIFTCLEEILKFNKKEYLLTDAMKILMKSQKFFGVVFSGKYFDIGSKSGYVLANLEYGLDNDETKDDLINYLKNLSI